MFVRRQGINVDFLGLIQQSRLVVCDGAMGTQLIARGLPAGVPGELWDLERPEVVEAIQRQYVAAGAELLLTNTFGANGVALARHGLADRLEEVNVTAVRIARRAAGTRAAVVGDLGPTGSLLAPVGNLSEQQARTAYAAQVRALASAGVDAIIAETFDSSQELRIALSEARDVGGLPLIASMKFTREKTGRYRTMMGEAPQALLAAAHELGCAVVGTNCGQGIATMVGLVAEIAALTDLPVIAQPNAGQPRLVAGRTLYEEDAATFAKHLPALFEAGGRLIGGCCGTTAEHVRAIRTFADSLEAGHGN